jgi:hypothetical protein
MELKISSTLTLGVSYHIETLRHDSITYLGGAEFDACPRGRLLCRLPSGVSRVDKECSGVLRVSAIGDLEGT